MQGLDSKFFGSWLVIAGIALLFGLLFALATALIHSMTGGEFAIGSQTIFMGCLASFVFFMVLRHVRHQIEEESEK